MIWSICHSIRMRLSKRRLLAHKATLELAKDGIQNASKITGLNELFELAKIGNVSLVRWERTWAR